MKGLMVLILLTLSLLSQVVLASGPMSGGTVTGSSSITFAPPPGDYSVVFLGNLFGIVDGVLHGSGSQIMGAMFAVFNSAVLALGGIIIMYTLMVSTMNTAHEGQMLGQKWSSIWIPVRSTAGMALLIPKASGYCMMQIFVMWVVVQGVGAADKVWNAALSYLNRGGVIIQAQQSGNPAEALLSTPGAAVAQGASVMLAGQVCMLGLQQQLITQRQSYLNGPTGTCSYNSDITTLCDNAVPDFVGSVNAVSLQTDMDNAATTAAAMATAKATNGVTCPDPSSSCPMTPAQQRANCPKTTKYTLPMPNFTDANYSYLNGMCGQIIWNPISFPCAASGFSSSAGLASGANGSLNGINNLSSSEFATAKMSRAIAIQQVYQDMTAVAQIMVSNDPQLNAVNTRNATNMPTPAATWANQQFGVPYTLQGASGGSSSVCPNTSNGSCQGWGPVPSGSSQNTNVLFSGTEFAGSISDYNGIMMPTLNLIAQSNSSQSANQSRNFITGASSQGWMMAGAYFFDLVQLNGSATTNSTTIDSTSGLDSSIYPFTGTFTLQNLFPSSGCAPTTTPPITAPTFSAFCNWFAGTTTYVQNTANSPIAQIITLIGSTAGPTFKQSSLKVMNQAGSSMTAYGFANNESMVQLPGQPGTTPLTFANNMVFTVDTTSLMLPWINFDCGGVTIVFFKFCFGWMIGTIFYDLMFLVIYNALMFMFQNIIEQTVMLFLAIPLQGMQAIFQQAVITLNAPGVNPIVALANMGVYYINFSGNLWIQMTMMAVSAVLIPVFGIFMIALMGLAMPLILSWVGIMTAVGFTTAYYIPLLPYMIFTFGTIAWFISVIEAMVAAPIVALGVTHPEGHDAFGKGEAAVMLLMNVFLRPSMMIIGYISAIALSYVGVWILNAGYDHAVSYFQGGALQTSNAGYVNSSITGSGTSFSLGSGGTSGSVAGTGGTIQTTTAQGLGSGTQQQGSGSGATQYTGWAGIYAYFFSILTYVTLYLTIVQKSFTLISVLPDKVLRWIGGSPETSGSESAQWAEDTKTQGKEAGTKTADAQGQIGKQMAGAAQKGADMANKGGGGGGEAGAS
ncbi:MAG: type IVB secretion system protein DotA [Legionellales bacterium]